MGPKEWSQKPGVKQWLPEAGKRSEEGWQQIQTGWRQEFRCFVEYGDYR